MISSTHPGVEFGLQTGRGPKRRFPRRSWMLILVCVAGLLLPMLPVRVSAQAVPAATDTSLGDVNNPALQQLPSQELGSTLTLNQGVRAINAENQEFQSLGVGGETYSGAQTNFFGTPTDPKTATFTDISLDMGLQLQSEHTKFFALYQPEYDIYPEYSEVSNFGQSYFHHLEHNFSERAAFAWDATAARYLTLNHYLPPTVGIGGVGIVVANAQTELLQNSFEMTNFGTSLTFHYLASERATFTSVLTGTYFSVVPIRQGPTASKYDQKFAANGGDFSLDYQLTARDTIGAEVTPIYLVGLQTSGHDEDEAIQATYQRQLTSSLRVRVGAGPLFTQSSNESAVNSSGTSYAVNASLARRVKQSQFTLTYGRAFVVSFFASPIIAHTIAFGGYIPISRNWIVTSGLTYVRDMAGSTVGAGTLYGGSGQLAYQIHPRSQIFVQYSRLSQNVILGQPTTYNFSQNQFGGGVRFNFGNPRAIGGHR